MSIKESIALKRTGWIRSPESAYEKWSHKKRGISNVSDLDALRIAREWLQDGTTKTGMDASCHTAYKAATEKAFAAGKFRRYGKTTTTFRGAGK